MKSNIIIQGHSLDELKKLPSESINCVVTSPPYWALRSYGISTEIIWDNKEGCEHKWGNLGKTLNHKSGETNPGKEAWYKNKEASNDFGNCFCLKCNAWKGQLGLESDFNLYIKHLCDIFDEIKRVLRKDGTCFVNLGDTYYTKSGGSFENDNLTHKSSEDVSNTSGINKANQLRGRGLLPSKSLCNIPARFSIEMQNRGWILRNEIIWHKPNCFPTSVKDRFTIDFEKIFFFVKNRKYQFEQQLEPVKQISINRSKYGWHGTKLPHGDSYAGLSGVESMGNRYCDPKGRNKRCVWTIPTKGFRGAHFAVFPSALIEPIIRAGCPIGGIILDPFFGSGTTGLVAKSLNRNYIGIEPNSSYIDIANKRIELWLAKNRLF